jgi:hypothetical protein
VIDICGNVLVKWRLPIGWDKFLLQWETTTITHRKLLCSRSCLNLSSGCMLGDIFSNTKTNYPVTWLLNGWTFEMLWQPVEKLCPRSGYIRYYIHTPWFHLNIFCDKYFCFFLRCVSGITFNARVRRLESQYKLRTTKRLLCVY